MFLSLNEFPVEYLCVMPARMRENIVQSIYLQQNMVLVVTHFNYIPLPMDVVFQMYCRSLSSIISCNVSNSLYLPVNNNMTWVFLKGHFHGWLHLDCVCCSIFDMECDYFDDEMANLDLPDCQDKFLEALLFITTIISFEKLPVFI